MTTVSGGAEVVMPPFAYFGGKTTLAGRIARLLPPHAHYVEPFAGGLSVLLAKPPSVMETVNDLDHRLMTFWKVLRERPGELERVCALTPHSRAEYRACADPTGDPGNEMEVARRVWVRLTQGRGGTQRPTGWRHHQNAAGASTGMPGYLAGYLARMAPVAARLARVSLECRPAVEVIDTYGRAATTLLYLDPPYPGSVRGGARYLIEMTDEPAHRQLAATAWGCAATVVVSGYGCPLYRDLYAGWQRHSWTALTNGDPGGRRARRREVIWSNRPLGQPGLFDEETR